MSSTSCFERRHFLPPTPPMRPWPPLRPANVNRSPLGTPDMFKRSAFCTVDTLKFNLSWPADVRSLSALFSEDKDNLFSAMRSLVNDNLSDGMLRRSLDVELDTGVLDLVICVDFGCCCWEGGDVTVNNVEDGGFWSRPQHTFNPKSIILKQIYNCINVCVWNIPDGDFPNLCVGRMLRSNELRCIRCTFPVLFCHSSNMTVICNGF